MHDLEFVPSESVWTGIQQGIAPRERRRVVAILWWLFPGMLLLGGGIMMYRHSASTSGIVGVRPAQGVHAGANGGAGESRPANSGVVESRPENGVKVENRTANGGVVENRQSNRERLGHRLTGSELTENGITGQELKENGQAGQVRADDITTEGVARENAAAKRVRGTPYHPGLIGGLNRRQEVSGPLLPVPVRTAVDGIRRPRHPWFIGFQAGGGGSTVYSPNGSALVSGSGSYGYYAATSATNPSTLQMRPAYSRSIASGSKRNEANVSVDYSYWAGIYGERPLSSRWSVDIGLNLHYYSVRFQTESQVNTYAPASATLFAASSLTYTPAAPNMYSSSQQTYVNNYYFLEVPVTAQWRINRSRTLPMFWRGGVIFSYLMSSNGLYFDSPSGEYKSDNGVVRRAQASVGSGLEVGLPIRGVQVQVGPEFQYALTGMLNTGSGGGHMMYGGMRVALMR